MPSIGSLAREAEGDTRAAKEALRAMGTYRGERALEGWNLVSIAARRAAMAWDRVMWAAADKAEKARMRR